MTTMPAKKREPQGTQAYYDALDARTKATALAIRRFLHRNAPELDEMLFMGVPNWKGNTWVCYIADYTDHVNLGFHKGEKIKDVSGLLEGTGKGLRHVKIKKGAPLPEKPLATIVRKAVEIDQG